MRKILIVDDEMEMRQLLRLYLMQNYETSEAEDGYQALEKIRKDDYDLMILDIMMPHMDGWQTIEEVRKISDLPIIFLTAKGSTEDKVNGFSTGADDYLVKPFEEAELMARIEALLRRTKPSSSKDEIIRYNGLILDISAREVIYDSQKINLTQTEYDLLDILIHHRGKALSREQLVEHIWGLDFIGEDRTVDSHVKNLREKLQKAGFDKTHLKTVWGIGYKAE
ncbi:response regulator transcription factor [Thalassobacillus devorans]|uniref:response regulator transcription factor n=1 Tax=Thalassobacillus devorans TaxID=279813 RepID=UPI00048DA9B2|nr:response regulator transcription factor [Thalassobacillus devorans]